MRDRQLNYRLLAGLLAVVVFFAGAVFLLHWWQNGRHARTLMNQAQRAEADGQLDRAVTCLQRYLVFAPQDNAARAHYGELLEQLAASPHDSWRAVTVYEEVLRREPARRDVRRRLAVLAVRLGWYVEGRAHLEILLRDEPEQGDLETLLGQCQQEAGEYPAAVVSYQNAIRHDPQRLEAYARLAGVLQYRLDRPEKVGGILDDMVRNNPRSAEACLARATHRAAHGSPAESGRDVQRALALTPDDPAILLAAAQLARRGGAIDEARRCLRHGRDLQPNNAAMHLELAALELEHGRATDALDALRQGLQALPDQPELTGLLAQTLLERGDEAEAETIIRRLHRSGAPPGLALYLTGRLQMKRRQWPEAIRTLEDVVHSTATAAVLAGRAGLALAQCHERLGNSDRRLAALRQAVARDESSPATRLALASALHDRGQIDEALEQCRQGMQRPQAPEQGWLLLARLLVQRNRSLPPHARQWTEAERALGRAARLPALEVDVAVLRAEVLAEQDRAEDARALLEHAAAEHPGEPELATALAEQALRRGRPARAARHLASAIRDPQSAIRIIKAEIGLCAWLPPMQAREKLSGLEKGLESSPSAQAEGALLLAAAYFQIGEQDEGRRLCRRLAERTPQDLPSRLPLLELALEGGEEELLAGLVADVRRLEGEDGTWWRYGEAGRLVLRARHGDTAGLDRAKELAAEIVRIRPDWPLGALLTASICEVRGDAEGEATAYLRAFRAGARRPGLTERLAGLLAEQGRLDDADEVIRKSQQQAPPSAELARLGAEIALRQRRHDRARELARRAVPAECRDPEKLVWLGQVLALADRQGEAEDALRLAVRLSGDRTETWVALIAYLARADHVADAESVRDEMKVRLPPPQRPLALALCAEVLNQPDAAERSYRQALERDPRDVVVLQRAASFHLRLEHSAQAEELLRRLLAEADLPATNQAWARRRLALLLAFGSAADGHAQALALLDENVRRKQETFLDRRARLLVRATLAAERPDALRRLEESSRARPFTAEELVCLVHLYETDDDAERARERMLDLLALDRDNPEYQAHHIDHLLRHGRKDDARPWIVRLQKLEPDSSRVRAFRGQLSIRK